MAFIDARRRRPGRLVPTASRTFSDRERERELALFKNSCGARERESGGERERAEAA